jgi:hypothetical protein
VANILDRRKEFKERPIMSRGESEQPWHHRRALPNRFEHQHGVKLNVLATPSLKRINITPRHHHIDNHGAHGNLGSAISNANKLSGDSCEHTRSVPGFGVLPA